MAVYLALCLFLCLGSVLWARELGFSNGIADEKRTARMQWAFLLLAGGLFVLVATVRYGIGYDYFNYERLYEQLGPMSAAQLVQDPVGKQFIGYSLLTHLLYRAGLDYRSLLLVINLLMTGVVLWFVKRYSPLPWMSLFFYLTLQFFAHSMNLFRQSIAATICLLAYPFLKKRKLLPFALVVLLAAVRPDGGAVLPAVLLDFELEMRRQTAGWVGDGGSTGLSVQQPGSAAFDPISLPELCRLYRFALLGGLGLPLCDIPHSVLCSGMADPALAACREARKSHFNQQLLLCDAAVCL